MGTAIVEREDMAAVVSDEQRTGVASDHHHPLGLQFVQGPDADQFVAARFLGFFADWLGHFRFFPPRRQPVGTLHGRPALSRSSPRATPPRAPDAAGTSAN